ncbi:hypothetical protein, partial [Candidatus Similichlamydia epinepheli]|uniref:hypothetical protein n=1 Tax=Candidatus Similichlamydia epinepheli TaxID=1903953 RepID=UPI00195F1CBE
YPTELSILGNRQPILVWIVDEVKLTNAELSKEVNMRRIKRLTDILATLDNLFPGVLKSALCDLIDPHYAENQEDLSMILEYNISILKKKLMTESNGNLRCVESACRFMENKRNFLPEQWQTIQKLKSDFSSFGAFLTAEMQRDSCEDIKVTKMPLIEKKKVQKKKFRSSRCDWMQA